MTSGVRSFTSSVRIAVSESAIWFCTTLMSGFSASKSAMIFAKSSIASPLYWKKLRVVTPSSASVLQPLRLAERARTPTVTAATLVNLFFMCASLRVPSSPPVRR